MSDTKLRPVYRTPEGRLRAPFSDLLAAYIHDGNHALNGRLTKTEVRSGLLAGGFIEEVGLTTHRINRAIHDIRTSADFAIAPVGELHLDVKVLVFLLDRYFTDVGGLVGAVAGMANAGIKDLPTALDGGSPLKLYLLERAGVLRALRDVRNDLQHLFKESGQARFPELGAVLAGALKRDGTAMDVEAAVALLVDIAFSVGVLAEDEIRQRLTQANPSYWWPAVPAIVNTRALGLGRCVDPRAFSALEHTLRLAERERAALATSV